MQFIKNENQYIIRLQKGENFNEKLLSFCEQEKITSAFFYGLGGTLSAELAYYNLESRAYQSKRFDTTMEIVSLTGNITLTNEKPFIHAHAVLSDENYECRGGHLKGAVIGGTCEIYLSNENLNLARELDNETGLKLINCAIK